MERRNATGVIVVLRLRAEASNEPLEKIERLRAKG